MTFFEYVIFYEKKQVCHSFVIVICQLDKNVIFLIGKNMQPLTGVCC